jgi:hypothetical protein
LAFQTLIRDRLALRGPMFYTFVEMAETQISAYISDTTREEVERYVAAHGVKKGSLIEQALLHHLQALRELPHDIVIPPQLRVSRRSFEQVTDLVRRPRKPTQALAELLSAGGGPSEGRRRNVKRARSRV